MSTIAFGTHQNAVTRATAALILPPRGIGFVEGMPMDTMGFKAIVPHPSSHILRMSHWFQMIWPNAMAHSAQVIQFQALRDRAHKMKVGPAVSAAQPVHGKGPITSRPSASPQPTCLGLVHLRPKPFFARNKWCCSGILTGHRVTSGVVPSVVSATWGPTLFYTGNGL